jgi:CBS domain-containing protein
MNKKFKTMTFADVMTRPVVCASPDTSAHEISEKLSSNSFSGMPIVENKTVIGIVSERDILQLFIQGKNLKSTLAQEFMTTNVITANQDSLVFSGIKAFVDNQILRLPITNNGKLVGIITRQDLLKVICDTTPEFALIS